MLKHVGEEKLDLLDRGLLQFVGMMTNTYQLLKIGSVFRSKSWVFRVCRGSRLRHVIELFFGPKSCFVLKIKLYEYACVKCTSLLRFLLQVGRPIHCYSLEAVSLL